MNFGIENILTWAGTLFALIGMWFRNQYKVERLSEKDTEQERKIEVLLKFKDSVPLALADIKEHMTRDISELRGSLLVVNEQFRQIITILSEIKDRLSVLENKRNG